MDNSICSDEICCSEQSIRTLGNIFQSKRAFHIGGGAKDKCSKRCIRENTAEKRSSETVSETSL